MPLTTSATIEDHSAPSISLAEILSALSVALDLTEGAVPGHALRCCLLGMRLAAEAGLPAHQRASLYYALLLKDVGCSSNSARMCSIIGGGDDRIVKAGAKLTDWTNLQKPSLTMLSLLWNNVLPQAGSLSRAVRIGKIALAQKHNNAELVTLRCDRGASIVRKLGFDAHTADAVRSLDEHWDGNGYPARLKGNQIPLLARICLLAQHLDIFSHSQGTQSAIDTLIARSGTWFDPELVRLTVSLHNRHALWTYAGPEDAPQTTRREVMDLDAGYDPDQTAHLTSERLDIICEAFADVVDAKSPFTFRHSMGVATAAHHIAIQMNLPDERVQLLRRAALLHDLGKLGVPNSILDKPGKLDAGERTTIEIHPGQSRKILNQVTAFRAMATIAGEHHEKLDGSGYPDRRVAHDLSLESRILAVADIYGALSEDRPYRPGMDPARIRSILFSEAPNKIDPDCLDALFAALAVTPNLAPIFSRATEREHAASAATPTPVAAANSTPQPVLGQLLEPLAQAHSLYSLTQNPMPF